ELPGQTIGIAHADCEDDVNYLISLLRQHRSELDIMTVMYEPVTGSHVGPGTLALFFEGSKDFR
ncbi:MAG TPA: fatty acid-binding protein DegV, partial [Clostridiales bacterium]|nr:fatty acid-binding protein DegV [Clostridiales bacterium]